MKVYMRSFSKKELPGTVYDFGKKSLKMDNLPGSKENIADFFPVEADYFLEKGYKK